MEQRGANRRLAGIPDKIKIVFIFTYSAGKGESLLELFLLN